MTTRLLAALAAFLLWATPAAAQNREDCGNGNWCPDGYACLIGGQCARMVDGPPGGVETSSGLLCDPGWRVGTFKKDSCVPPGYVECRNGNMCPPPNAQCVEGGGCEGGPPSTGPMCGGRQCAEGRFCSSQGQCVNGALFQDCGTGSICSHASACTQPRGCAYGAPDVPPSNAGADPCSSYLARAIGSQVLDLPWVLFERDEKRSVEFRGFASPLAQDWPESIER
jgi:hypothetical protein